MQSCWLPFLPVGRPSRPVGAIGASLWCDASPSGRVTFCLCARVSRVDGWNVLFCRLGFSCLSTARSLPVVCRPSASHGMSACISWSSSRSLSLYSPPTVLVDSPASLYNVQLLNLKPYFPCSSSLSQYFLVFRSCSFCSILSSFLTTKSLVIHSLLFASVLSALIFYPFCPPL